VSDRFISAYAKLYQHLHSRPDPVPLSPVTRANAPPDPFVEIMKLRLIQAAPKIADPALKITPQFAETPLNRNAAVAASHFFDAIFEIVWPFASSWVLKLRYYGRC
jgi:hypothetical protein